ncbi:MAG: peptide permease [Desulfurococcales archaeon]|nr:peptide permease [Desulfurococcales archaeon]
MLVRGRRDLSSILRAIYNAYEWFEKRPKITKWITVAALIIITAIAIYIRAIPALVWGMELHGNDPWIEYWTAKYVYEHGPLSWWSLTSANPDTHIFWYPWGRDFVTSTYPGTSLWTAITYYLIGFTGITLKDWIIVQPLIFAAISVFLAYLAVKEIMDSKLAGIIGALFYALVPAASDRTIVGFVEKEGLALAFVFMFIYMYSKMVKEKDVKKRRIYAILSGLSMALVGWFWGGYSYMLAAFTTYLALYPVFAKKEFSKEFLINNLLVFGASIVLVSPSLTIFKTLGLYPFKTSIGVGVIASLVLPIGYYYLGIQRKILTKWRYTLLLAGLVIAGIAGLSLGFIHIGARYAYALGLRFVPTGPLVQSIEEHQPAFIAHGLIGVLKTWGWTGFFLAILGVFYLLYKGRPDHILVSIIFAIAFYAYMNATYFEAVASSLGLITASAFASYFLLSALPSKKIMVKRKRGYVSPYEKSSVKLFALILFILVIMPVVYSGYDTIQEHRAMIPSIMAAGAPLPSKNYAWYDTIDFLNQNTSKDSLVVSWWDYGYWISVNTGRATLADGATLNGSQINLLARILTSFDENEALSILRELKAPKNNTYVLVFDVFRFIRQKDNTYIVVPVAQPNRLLIGLVDIPKSIWMIRIGRRDPSKYLFLYNYADQQYFVSPRFDQPEDLPLIYRMMVDGILYLNEQSRDNTTYKFVWYTGQAYALPSNLRQLQEQLGVNTMVRITGQVVFDEQARNRTRMKYFIPYKVIAEPFEKYSDYYVVIFIYKVAFPET